MNNQIRVLAIGPRPPNVGGMESFIRDFEQYVNSRDLLTIIPIYILLIHSCTLGEVFSKIKSILNNVKIICISSKKRCFDIAHIHTTSYVSWYENAIYILILKVISRTPIVLHIHAPDFEEFIKNPISHFVVKHVLVSVSHIIVLSEYWKSFIMENFANYKSISIVHNAPSENFILKLNEVKFSNNKSNEKKNILAIGNLTYRKGFDVLVKSIPNLTTRNAVCTIVGSGEATGDLKSLVAELGLQNSVFFFGRASDEELVQLYGDCSVVVLPSRGEGSPIVMFESLICGKPFIGTKVGSIPEIISSDDYGYICEVDNVQDLSKKLDLALGRNWDNEKISKYGEQYSWNRVTESIIEIYKNLML